jgi:hypothetical protein
VEADEVAEPTQKEEVEEAEEEEEHEEEEKEEDESSDSNETTSGESAFLFLLMTIHDLAFWQTEQRMLPLFGHVVTNCVRCHTESQKEKPSVNMIQGV